MLSAQMQCLKNVRDREIADLKEHLEVNKLMEEGPALRKANEAHYYRRRRENWARYLANEFKRKYVPPEQLD